MKTKIILLLFLGTALSLQTAYAQSETEKEVSKIRSSVLRVNKLLSVFRKTTKSVEGISTEGTEAAFYSSKKALQKIEADIAGETYNAKAHFYYDNAGRLIFAYYRFNRYDTHISMNPPPKVVKIEEKRLYFKNGKMIKKITTVTETGLGNDIQKSEQDVLDLENLFQKAYCKK